MTAEESLVAAIVEELTDNRPSGLDASVAVRAENDVAEVENPRLVIAAGGAQAQGHRSVVSTTVTATLSTQTDDTTAGDAGDWAQAVKARMDSADFRNTVRTMLYDSDLILRKFYPAQAGMEQGVTDRGREHRLSWDAIVQTALPDTGF